MEYHGKLYGKIGNKYFYTGKTSKDFDEMFEILKLFLNEFEYDNATEFECNLFFDARKLLTKITQ